MVALGKRKICFTPEEYLAMERVAGHKSQYIDGRIYAMPGGSIEHNTIANNIGGELRALLKGTPCRALSNDQKVRTGTKRVFAYPDVTVACDPLVFHDEKADVLVNPVALIEVLSLSTEAEDRGVKWLRYQTIKPLQHYVLVSQNEPRVEWFTRDSDGGWYRSEVMGLDGSVFLAAINVTLSLVEIYDRIEFAAGSNYEPVNL